MNVQECMHLMTEKYIRHLPVLKQGRLIGIVTIGDIVKNIISDQSKEISDLKDYVSGAGYK